LHQHYAIMYIVCDCIDLYGLAVNG